MAGFVQSYGSPIRYEHISMTVINIEERERESKQKAQVFGLWMYIYSISGDE